MSAASPPAKGGWQRVGAGFSIAGRALSKAAISAGQGAAAAWQAVDPDLRRHLMQLPVMGLTMLGPARPPLEALPADGYRPVVFVHGLGGHRGNFVPMRAYFRYVGRSRTYAVGFAADANLDAMAAALRGVVAEVLERNGLPAGAQIDLVAHSMGGLVCRLALEDPETAQRVAHLVTLGTPHAGTHVARFASTGHTLDLRPDSDLVVRLRRQVPWAGPPALPHLSALWSRADMLLLPADTGCVAGAENIEMEGFTHYSYLLHARAWRQVAAELERG